jgi:hypothetical protein
MLDLQKFSEVLNTKTNAGIVFDNFLPKLEDKSYTFREKDHTTITITGIDTKYYRVLETDVYKGTLNKFFQYPYGKTSDFSILKKTENGYIFYLVELKSQLDDCKTYEGCHQIRGSFRLVTYLIHTLCDHQQIEKPSLKAKGLILYKTLYKNDPDETSFTKPKNKNQNWHPDFTIKTKETPATSEYTLEEFLKFF